MNSSFGFGVGELGLILEYFDATYIPVELISFSGFYANEKVTLDWETATEINNSGFELQKSKDKENWQSIGFVRGSGSSTEYNKYRFIDNASLNEKNYYCLKQIDFNGTYDYLNVIEVTIPINSFQLHQNFPNPFNPITTINYSLAANGFVELEVVDIIGKRVAVLVNEFQTKGNHNISFDASTLASGVYVYKLKVGDFINIKKMILLK